MVNVAFLILLLCVAIIDIKTLKIPLWSLAVVLLLCAIKGKFDSMDFVFGFGTMWVSQILSDSILGRETIGGGDVWMGALISLFIGFDKFIYAFTISAFLSTVGMIYLYNKRKILDVAYMPYLACATTMVMGPISKICLN